MTRDVGIKEQIRYLVSPHVCHELISETAPRIFPKLGMTLEDIKGKKIAEPFFVKNSHFAQIWPNVPKNDHFDPKSEFAGQCQKNDSNIFSKIALKVGAKIVLLDGIVILPEKIQFWA